MKRTVLLMTALLCASGCSEDPVDIGDDGAGGTEGPDGASSQTWVGYVEPNIEQPLSSDRIVIERNDDGSGTLLIGGESVPPATDPDVGYPPSLQTDGESGILFPLEGYRYDFSSSSLDSLRLELELDVGQVWSDWCVLQTSFPDPANARYACNPPAGTGFGEECALIMNDGAEWIPIDCGKMYLCQPQADVCVCDESGCVQRSIPNTETLARTDSRLDGPIGDLMVHLELE